MIEIVIPGRKTYQLKHLVLDYNGTLACDGDILTGVKDPLLALSEKLHLHVLTADTFGKAKNNLGEIPCTLTLLPVHNQDRKKGEYVKHLLPENTVCIGNGRNDLLMLKEAVLSIAVVQEEGAAVETLLAADVVCKDIVSALNLLANPLRLVATLRK